MRWDLIDRFEVLQKGRFSRARKAFSGREDFFEEHFPGRPAVPETLLLEMIAQAGGVLYGFGLGFKKEVILAKIADARFLAPVFPPCEFIVEATLEEEREEGAWVSGVVSHAGTQTASAKVLLAAIEPLTEKKSVVFNDHFLKHYDIDNVAKACGELR